MKQNLLVIKSLLAAGALIALIVLATSVSPTVKFLTLPPAQKFYFAWQSDLELLKKSNTLPSGWEKIGDVQVETNNTTVQSWLNKPAPIVKVQNGTNKLSILVVHWIQDYRYGVMIQYTLIDGKSGNLLSQFGRNLKLGYIY